MITYLTMFSIACAVANVMILVLMIGQYRRITSKARRDEAERDRARVSRGRSEPPPLHPEIWDPDGEGATIR